MGDDAPPTPPKAGFAPPPEAPAAGNGTGLTQRVPTHAKRMERVTTSGYVSVPVQVEGTDWTKLPAAEIFKEKLFSKNQGSAKKAFVQTLFFVMVLAAVTSVLTVMEFQKPATVTRVTVANPTTAEVQSGSFNYTEWYMGKQAVAAKETSELQCMCKNPSVPISTIVDASESPLLTNATEVEKAVALKHFGELMKECAQLYKGERSKVWVSIPTDYSCDESQIFKSNVCQTPALAEECEADNRKRVENGVSRVQCGCSTQYYELKDNWNEECQFRYELEEIDIHEVCSAAGELGVSYVHSFLQENVVTSKVADRYDLEKEVAHRFESVIDSIVTSFKASVRTSQFLSSTSQVVSSWGKQSQNWAQRLVSGFSTSKAIRYSQYLSYIRAHRDHPLSPRTPLQRFLSKIGDCKGMHTLPMSTEYGVPVTNIHDVRVNCNGAVASPADMVKFEESTISPTYDPLADLSYTIVQIARDHQYGDFIKGQDRGALAGKAKLEIGKGAGGGGAGPARRLQQKEDQEPAVAEGSGKANRPADWAACGGTSSKCAQDKACVTCANAPTTTCERETEWFWQCVPKEGAPEGGGKQPTAEMPAEGGGKQPAAEMPEGGGKQPAVEMPEGGGKQPTAEMPAEGGGKQPTAEMPAGGGKQPTAEMPAEGGGKQPTAEMPAEGGGKFPGPEGESTVPVHDVNIKLAAAGDWEQCGGESLKGCDEDAQCAECTRPGWKCLREHQWYYQCVPPMYQFPKQVEVPAWLDPSLGLSARPAQRPKSKDELDAAFEKEAEARNECFKPLEILADPVANPCLCPSGKKCTLAPGHQCCKLLTNLNDQQCHCRSMTKSEVKQLKFNYEGECQMTFATCDAEATADEGGAPGADDGKVYTVKGRMRFPDADLPKLEQRGRDNVLKRIKAELSEHLGVPATQITVAVEAADRRRKLLSGFVITYVVIAKTQDLAVDVGMRVDNIKAGGVQLSAALTEYGLGNTIEASSPEVKGVQQDQLEAEYQAQLTAATEVENFVVVDATGMSQVKTFAITSPDEDAIWTLDEPRGATVEWQTTVVDETAKINILIESLQVDGTWDPITVATNVAAFNATKEYGNSNLRSGSYTFTVCSMSRQGNEDCHVFLEPGVSQRVAITTPKEDTCKTTKVDQVVTNIAEACPEAIQSYYKSRSRTTATAATAAATATATALGFLEETRSFDATLAASKKCCGNLYRISSTTCLCDTDIRQSVLYVALDNNDPGVIADACVPILEDMTEADVGNRIEEQFMSAENCAISGGDYSPTFTLEASDRLFCPSSPALDCTECAATGCNIEFVGDGVCDLEFHPECTSDACHRDAGDCGLSDRMGDSCAPGCSYKMLGDGVCDTECNNVDCKFDTKPAWGDNAKNATSDCRDSSGRAIKGSMRPVFASETDARNRLSQCSTTFPYATLAIPCDCSKEPKCKTDAELRPKIIRANVVEERGLRECSVSDSQYEPIPVVTEELQSGAGGLQDFFFSCDFIEFVSEYARRQPDTESFDFNAAIEEAMFRSDKWNDGIHAGSYSTYIDQCQPMDCSYDVEVHPTIASVAPIVLGIIGGLVTVLQVVVMLLFTPWKTRGTKVKVAMKDPEDEL